MLVTASLSANVANASSEVVLRLDERQIRAAGITSIAIEQERAESELSLPGTVVIPPQQLHVIAAPANGMVESMLVAADEQVKAGQPIARLRSPEGAARSNRAGYLHAVAVPRQSPIGVGSFTHPAARRACDLRDNAPVRLVREHHVARWLGDRYRALGRLLRRGGGECATSASACR